MRPDDGIGAPTPVPQLVRHPGHPRGRRRAWPGTVLLVTDDPYLDRYTLPMSHGRCHRTRWRTGGSGSGRLGDRWPTGTAGPPSR